MKSVRYWTAAVTFWREERRAAHHVENLGLKYFLPETRDGDDRRVLIFPGVIFVRLAGEGWQRLFRCKGVSQPIMMPVDDETLLPARVTRSEMQRIRDMAADDKILLHPRFRDGMSVVVESAGGVYEGIRGLVRGYPRGGRVTVSWTMMGRTVRKDFSESTLRAA